MKPNVSTELRSNVAKLVKFASSLGRGQAVERYQLFLPDAFHFYLQNQEFQRHSIKPLIGMFKDDLSGEKLPVVIQIIDITNFETSFKATLRRVREGGLELAEATVQEANEIFIDRLSEFIAVKQQTTSATPTIVHSNRSGDTVLYAKGYFFSTATAFGVSNPATGFLTPGRYSFGILDNGIQRFDNIVWTCPTTVQLNKP